MYYASLKLSKHIVKTPEGYLLCLGVPVARTGTLEYAAGELPDITPDERGIISVSRGADVLFSKETIASLEGKDITIDHPAEDLAPDNWRKLAQGHVQNVRQGTGDQQDLLLADFLIKSPEAISLVLDEGLREISLGYDADYVEEKPGVGRQTQIVVNHVALVDRGRCGSRCAIQDREKVTMAKTFWDRVFKSAKLRKSLQDAAEEVLLTDEDVEKVVVETPRAEAPKAEPQPQPATDADPLEAVLAGLEEIKLMLASLVEAKTVDEEQCQDEEEVVIADEEPTADEGEIVVEEAGSISDECGEGNKTADSDILRRAAILAPSLGVRTGDSKAAVMRASLRMAGSDKDTAKIISGITGGRSLDKLPAELLTSAFIAASEYKAAKNNLKTADRLKAGVVSRDNREITPADINKLNKEFYGRK